MDDISVLRVRAGDILVLHFPQNASVAQAEAVEKSGLETLRSAGHDKIGVLVLCGASLSVVRAGDDDAQDLEPSATDAPAPPPLPPPTFLAALRGRFTRRTKL